ncbi:MAG TPA: VOC family protein [Nitrososphaeraceae archaeon]|nr:VOC family protein [Nitrososphaeraceae archaeon]
MTATVKAIPEEHHTITPYLVVKNGAQAIEFYKKGLGAEERFRMNGPDGKSIVHVQLKMGDSVFMLADEFPQMNSLSPESIGGSPVSMYVYVEDVDAVFNQAVSAGATVLNPVMDMFYGDRWGYIRDPFGHLWSIATHKKDLTPDELKKAAEIAFAEMSRKTKE